MPGVGQVSIFGQKLYAARARVNPAALAAHGIGLEDVRNALANATVNEPKGSIEGAHQVVTLETNDQLFNAAAYGNIIIAYRHGAPVRIKDVGDVVNSVQNTRVGAWFNNRPAEGVAIQKAPGANTVALVDTIKALMPKLEQSIPPSVHVDLMLDRTLVTRAAVRDVQFTMLLTISSRHHRDLCVPADNLGNGDPESLGAAVAARDLRGDVRRRVQPRQHLADGVDHLGRLCRR